MTVPVVAALTAAGLVAVADWIAVARGDLGLERLAKPAVMVCLVAAVVLAGPGSSMARWLLIVALAASLAGDVLLLPPGRFMGGLSAFLLAHLAYLAIFLLGEIQLVPLAAGVVAVLALLSTVGRTILTAALGVGMGWPVSLYFVAICAMAVAATASASLPATAGAWLFVASDSILGWDRFAAAPAAGPGAAMACRLAVVVPYHAAQLLLTVALLGLSA